MLDIFNGRKAFFQWDSGQKLTVSHAGICEVHFHHPGHDSALVVKIYELEGQRVADVPNILLQEAGGITAYIYICIGDECTVFSKKFEVIPRQKPADYVYTETETKTYKALEDRIKALEQGGASDADIMAAIEKYMQENPVQIEETDPSVPSWAKEPEPPKYTAQDVGALPADTPIPDPYTLPVASAETLGGVKVGDGLQVDVNGRVSVEPEGDYGDAPIETITLEEDAALLRTEEPDGTPYNFDAVFLKLSTADKVLDYNGIYFYGMTSDFVMYTVIYAGLNQNEAIECAKDKGYWMGKRFNATDGGTDYPSVSYTGSSQLLKPQTRATGQNATIKRIASLAALPAGTTIEIWGVRA